MILRENGKKMGGVTEITCGWHRASSLTEMLQRCDVDTQSSVTLRKHCMHNKIQNLGGCVIEDTNTKKKTNTEQEHSDHTDMCYVFVLWTKTA